MPTAFRVGTIPSATSASPISMGASPATPANNIAPLTRSDSAASPTTPANSNPSVPTSSPSYRSLSPASGPNFIPAPVPGSSADNPVGNSLREQANQTAANNAEYGRGYNPRYTDEYDPTNLKFGNDRDQLERLGYNNYGDALKDAAGTLANMAKNALGGLIPNWFDPKKYRDPKGNALPTGTAPAGEPGVQYRVTITLQARPQESPSTGTFTVTAPFSIGSAGAGDQVEYFLSSQGGQIGLLAAAPDLIIQAPTITNAERVDGQPTQFPEPNRVAFPDPDLTVDPGADAKPAPAPAVPAAPAPAAPYPFPDYPGLPSPNRAPTPTKNPTNAPSNAPAPAPLTTPAPGLSPSSPASPLKAPSPKPTADPSTSKETTPNPTLDPETKQFKDPESPTETSPKTPENCKDPCIQKLNDKADEAKPVSITVKVFKACKTDNTQGTNDSNAIFEDKTIKVPKAETDSYKLLYERLAKLEALQCDKSTNAIASVPEWWQLRAEAQRPQLVIIFAEIFGSGKLGKSRWSLTIPHYNKPKGYKPNIASYQKGSYQGVLTLTDNSKLIVNAKTSTECKRMLNSLKLFVPASYRTRNGKGIKPKIAELPDAGFKECRVTPIRGDFYKTGTRSMEPDWSINFRLKP